MSELRTNVRINKKIKIFCFYYNQEIDYQTLEPILITTVNASTTIRPTQGRIWLDVSVFEQFLQSQGDTKQDVERARSYYNRLNWQFYRKLWDCV